MQILLITDDLRVAEFLVRGLRAEARYVVHAPCPRTGMQQLNDDPFDLVLLGLAAVGETGPGFCRSMRSSGITTPVLVLSSQDAATEGVRLLRAGADDYLAQPFDFDELLARIDALVRRASRFRADGRIRTAALRVGPILHDPETLTTFVDGQSIEMSTREREMLSLFLSSPGRVCTRERILSTVWGLNKDPLTNVVDVYVSKLRRKLGPHAGLLKTLRGAGYRLDPG